MLSLPVYSLYDFDRVRFFSSIHSNRIHDCRQPR
jgi:hypothetical protein